MVTIEDYHFFRKLFVVLFAIGTLVEVTIYWTLVRSIYHLSDMQCWQATLGFVVAFTAGYFVSVYSLRHAKAWEHVFEEDNQNANHA